MKLEDLLPDTLRATADSAARFIIDNPTFFEEMLDLAFSNDRSMGMRASRVVLLCYLQIPDLVKPHLSDIFDRLYITDNSSTIRNMIQLFQDEAQLLDEKRFGKLIQFCFNLLESPNAEIAHRVLAMQVLYNISNQIPDFKGELKSIIELNFEEGTAAFKSRGNHILKKLNKEIMR